MANILQQFKRNVIEQQQSKLEALKQKSADALDIVTSTINNLDSINAEIGTVINEIVQYKSELSNTETELQQVKENNLKVSNKFRSLIE